MDFTFSIEEQQLATDVRQFIKEEVTPELIAETHELEFIYGGPLARQFFKKFAANGWLTPSWPKKYGGLELPEIALYIVKNELAYAGLPFLFSGAFLCGPSIMRHCDEKTKQKFLIPIAKGEIEFALGYSEPGAGSDLMSLEMTAEDRGDHFVVNGQKTFNTHAHVADYHWLAVRTDPAAPKHKGISLLMVDMKSEGITIRPMISMAGTRTNEVYYDNVVVPKENLVGEKNQGAKYIMVALDLERMFAYGHYQHFFEKLVAYTRETIIDCQPLLKNPLVRQKIARLETQLDVIRLLYFRLAHILGKGEVPTYQSSMEKNVLADFAQELANSAMEILGMPGQIKAGDRRAILEGRAQWLYRFTVVENIWGGSAEIQKSIIAQRGLGLPRG
ncbi:acyl-CoA dehydrogenase family protein [uncultured Desulfosarcina sp.]|uniref:acyl-CoA dehydrogenase family protein n=1 Tax=uncultured Desulfosarcina sp. TaxID=218289 RepID=UPI0029C67086|nr:acyl-CoA dehydrogenase family protein [uncultured Desulfosarcina sp.]